MGDNQIVYTTQETEESAFFCWEAFYSFRIEQSNESFVTGKESIW